MSTSISPWRSIRRKLPLSIILLLIGVVGIFTALAYQGLKRSRLEIAGDRLRQVARELADLTQQSVEARIGFAERIASDPRVIAVASGNASEAARLEVLFDSLTESTRGTAGFQLVAGAGNTTVDANAPIGIAGERGVPAPLVAHVGPIRVHDDSIFSETIAPVLDADSNIVARLVHSRRATSAEQVRDLLTELIGGDALFLVGNIGDGVWTDLVNTVSGPSIDIAQDTLAHRYFRADVGERYGAAALVDNAPWIILVEYPLATVLAPAHKFVTQIAIIAVLLIVVGGLGASLLSHRITKPLREATRTAESVASGDYGVRLTLDRKDEIGQLAHAFNVMAEKVEAAHHRLEDQVAERTEELNETLEQLKSTQSDLVRSEKLAILGQLSSGLGHELRNPLGVMSNAVYFLNAITDSSTDKVRQYLTIIQEQIDLSEGIISALLDYARAKKPVTCATRISDIVADQVRRVADEDGISIDVDVADDLFVEADPVQLGQVLFNLLTNGKQALEQGHGTITIRAQALTQDTVAIQVGDTGRGIPNDELERIFEPLYTTKARGIGLGLAVTNSFVSLHGGTISVDSREGVGSTFTIHWPAAVAVGVT